MDNTWRFEIVDGTQQEKGIESGITDTLGSGTDEKSNTKKSKKGFSEIFANKAENNLIQQTVISPLNTVTGGLASPVYRSAKSIISGGNVGGALASLSFATVLITLNEVKKKLDETSEKVNNLNLTDNALIRAGSVSNATYYRQSFFGIKTKTNRS